MIRAIEWKNKTDKGDVKWVRVRLHGGQLQWQFKEGKAGHWDGDLPPQPEDWERLADEMEKRYRRNRVQWKDVELVRKMRSMGR